MNKKKSGSEIALLILEKTVDGIVRYEDFRHHMLLYDFERPLGKTALSQALKRLREKGLVEKELISDSEVIFKLTKAGRNKAILLKDEDENWDGKWRIVVFDIPEKRRSARKFLRKKLIDWSFRKWQKSVWACKKDCADQLEEVIKEAGIEDWVLVLESNRVGPKSF